MPSPVTLLHVAQAAHVSKTTVSNVFNAPERVRPELRAHVEEVARLIGYTGPDPRGRLLSRGKVNAIGLVGPADNGFSWYFTDPYMSRFLAGVAQVCEERGVWLSMVSPPRADGSGGPRDAVADGFILGSPEQAALIEPAMRRKLPFVVMDADGGPDMSSVQVDGRGGARRLTEHLIGLGHRHFAIATRGEVSDAPRIAGIVEALQAGGLDFAPVFDGSELSAADEATAIIALSAPLALEVLAAAVGAGISVPDRLSIAGLGDTPAAATASPPLTMMSEPVEEKGRMAARLLLDEGPVQHVVLKEELVVRGSTARVGEGRQ